MRIATFPGQFALAQPFWSPDEEGGGGDIDPAFIETPEDREPEGDDPEPVEIQADPEPEAKDTPEPEVPEAAAEGEDGGDAEDDEPPETKRRDWGLKRRVDKLTATTKALEKERDDAIAQAKALQELYSKPEGERTDAEREALRLQVRGEEAARIREEFRVQNLNKAADKLFDDGAKAFPNTWDKRVTELRDLFGEELGKRPDFLEAVTDFENSPAIWHELGGDPEQMDRLLSLPPVRLGIELAKMSVKLSAPKQPPVSRAPAPIKPLQDLARDERPLDDLINDPNASMAEIDRRMRSAEEAKWKSEGRRR